MSSTSSEEAKFRKKVEVNRTINNEKFRSKIQGLLKNRKNKKTTKNTVKTEIRSKIFKPKHSPKEVLGRKLFEYDYPYRPPRPSPSYRSSNPILRDRSVTNTRLIKSSKEPTSPKKSIWPPPPDTNYRRSPSISPANLQVEELHCDSVVVNQQVQQVEQVDCELCGKKGFSGPKQLKCHQASQKCKNRQLHGLVHNCNYCHRVFDTPHNLYYHNCHKY